MSMTSWRTWQTGAASSSARKPRERMRRSISLLVALLSTVLVSSASSDLRRNLGSKTPYYPQQSAPYTPAPAGCTAVHLNLVLRHGARNPGDDEIEGFNALAEKLSRIETLDDRYGWMQGWRFPVAVEDEGLLLPLGMREHYELGKRLRRLFPQAFPRYHPNVYSIRGTYKTRTGQSALSFAYGAFEGDGPLGEAGYMPVHMHMDSEKEDVQLRFLDLCEKYQTQVDTNVTAFAEYHDFLQGKEFQAVMKMIASILSPGQPLSAEQQITPEDVLLAFEACAYDIILEDGNQERWCSLFTPESVEIVNYALDLEDHIQRGFAYDITGKAAMMLLRDVVADMDKFIHGEAKTQQWRFAHDSTILPFATLLGLFKDKDPLTSVHVDPHRRFRTSRMIPFAANAVLALYDCPAQDAPWRIKLLWNEQEMVIPGCERDDPEQALYCDYTRFRSSYADIVDEWKFEEVCGSRCACAWGQYA